MKLPSIATLSAQEIRHLLFRHRRGRTLERYEPEIDAFLQQVLRLSHEFIPSSAGLIMLDDPKKKLLDARSTTLSGIGAFGPHAARVVQHTQPCHEGMAGEIYLSGKAVRGTTEAQHEMCAALEPIFQTQVTSFLGVPVRVGNVTCGVFLLINPLRTGQFSERDRSLLAMFADYISSSLQNILDALRSREVARRDDLTGLYNDRYFQFRLREEITRARKEHDNIGLLFIDLDDFKAVNDRYGHLEGSRTLHETGLLLQRELTGDIVTARYGGDEFVAILPHTHADQAVLKAHEVREAIVQHAFLKGGDIELAPGTVTASIGVASLQAHLSGGGTPREAANTLIRAADSAMYEAKAAGKNTVVMAATDIPDS